ncbi:MAG: HAMP domain-containing histidine kinase, partial [Kofleriaceae bacterium]|nr:HAMP domain-containing histidine kinase [Kofleriaceae bacterium]
KAERVVKEAIRLETLTTDLLDFVRTGEIRTAPCSPKEILEAASKDVNSSRIVIDTASSPSKCEIDGGRMQLVLSNLLRNATEASDGKVLACVKQEGASLVFEVRDWGPGIPKDQLDHVFDAFHTTRVQGTGLGLAVVRRVVELHRGSVTASNHEEGGALFRIKIPIGKT